MDQQRTEALARFVKERGAEGSKRYVRVYRELLPIVTGLFAVTDDLREFSGKTLGIRNEFLAAARYLAGPPVSADDLETLTGGGLGRRSLGSDPATRVADVLRSAWDPLRFPWLKKTRGPTNAERAVAIRWTTGIWAIEKLRTSRRTESSKRQENATVNVLRQAGFAEQPRPRYIDEIDRLPRGTFIKEANLAGSKCDIPVRLHDGRLFAIECKVSNSGLNSVKRLVRETGGKARAWRNAFGLQVVTCAVLAGVFKLGNLEDVQDNYGVVIFWEHDLSRLRAFVTDAR